MACLVVSPKRVNALKRAREAIEESTGVELSIKPDGSVDVNGDSSAVWEAEQVCRAIGYGFTPKSALKLLKEDCFFEVINLKRFYSGKHKKVKRYKARVIGSEGRVKRNLQELSGAEVSIFGDDVAILGGYEDLQDAKLAVYKILEGSEHSTAYAFLERIKQRR